MNRELYNRIRNYCREHQLIEEKDKIVIGLSGGADSVFLCCFLKEVAAEWNLQLHAVHVNHGIRGQEAKADETFCRNFTEKMQMPFTVYSADIPAMARNHGMSEEEAGRTYRYQCMEDFCDKNGFTKIAVAHHSNDQAETVLFQLLRGSGLRGLGGMRPARGRIIRPLLAVERAEIEAFLQEEKLSWCMDSTNLEDEYARNRLRHHILPALDEFAGGCAVQHLCRTAEQMQEYYDYIQKETDRIWSESVTKSRCGCDGLPASAEPDEQDDSKEPDISQGRECSIAETVLRGLPVVLQKEIILRMIEWTGGRRKDITARHVESVRKLAEGMTGKRVSLPYRLKAEREYDILRIAEQPEVVAGREEYCIDFQDKEPAEMTVHLPAEGQVLEIYLEKVSRETLPKEVPKNDCTKWFDYARIDSILKFRHPEAGDYFEMMPDRRRKKLSRYLIDQKVPVRQRSTLWVLAAGNHVFWIPQLGRSSAGAYVTDATQMVLRAGYRVIKSSLSK